MFAAKRAAIKNEVLNISEEHKLQYLQVPILLKLYTSEITLDTRLYFKLGGLIELKIEERAATVADPSKSFIEKFTPLDVAFLLGAGIEYDISPPTSLSIGISYQRGLVNAIKSQASIPGVPKVIYKNDFLSLDLGIGF